MIQCAKQMIEAKIAAIETKMQPMSEELTRLAGRVDKASDFWLLDAKYHELKGELDGIDFVLRQLGYERMYENGKLSIVDRETYLKAIGWDQFEGGAEG